MDVEKRIIHMAGPGVVGLKFAQDFIRVPLGTSPQEAALLLLSRRLAELGHVTVREGVDIDVFVVHADQYRSFSLSTFDSWHETGDAGFTRDMAHLEDFITQNVVDSSSEWLLCDP